MLEDVIREFQQKQI